MAMLSQSRFNVKAGLLVAAKKAPTQGDDELGQNALLLRLPLREEKRKG